MVITSVDTNTRQVTISLNNLLLILLIFANLGINIIYIEHGLIDLVCVNGGVILLLDELVVSFQFFCECILYNASHALELSLQVLQLLVARRNRLLNTS